MVHKLIQNRNYYLLLRGKTYYFRYAIPTKARRLCPNLPIEVKRSLRTDSYTDALAFIAKKFNLIKILHKASSSKIILKLIERLLDFSEEFSAWAEGKANSLNLKSNICPQPHQVHTEPKAVTLLLSESWVKFVKWKSWTKKRAADNQRQFDNLIYFIGDKPVGDITKKMLRNALEAIASLPQRNMKPCKGQSLSELLKIKVPDRHKVSNKSVKEHLKLCQSLFSCYLMQDKI